MRIIFAGTPEFAASHLQALLNEPTHEIVAVYTQPDRRAGRGKKLVASPVKQIGLDAGITVEQPLSLKGSDQQQRIAKYQADIMVVAAYGMLLPAAVLDIPRYGCINIHASLLPRWRGAAPVERAIIANDSQTGITIMQMDAGLDTGDMLLKASCSISSEETGDSLRARLAQLGRPLLLNTLQQISDNNLQPEQQDDTRSTYARKLEKSEGQINWEESADLIARKIRAFTSALSSYALLGEQRIRITGASAIDNIDDNISNRDNKPGEILELGGKSLLVACGTGILSINHVQLPGSKAMSITALLNGKPDFFKPGMVFSRQD